MNQGPTLKLQIADAAGNAAVSEINTHMESSLFLVYTSTSDVTSTAWVLAHDALNTFVAYIANCSRTARRANAKVSAGEGNFLTVSCECV